MTPVEISRIAEEVAVEANRELKARGGNTNALPSIFDRLMAKRYLPNEDAVKVRSEAASRAAMKRNQERMARG